MTKVIRDYIVEGKLSTVDINSSVCEAISVFSKLKTDYVLIQDGDSIKGIFTETDLAKRIVCSDKDVGKTKLADVMSKDMICADLNTDIDSCMFVMMKNRIKHLPIRDNDGKIFAVAGVLDLLKAKFEEVQDFQQASNLYEANKFLVDKEDDIIAKSLEEYK